MDFEDRIKDEHEEFRKMLTQLSNTGIEDVDLRMETYSDLSMRVDAHEQAEEQTLYKAMKDDEELRELALEALEQHRIARVLMVELRKVNLDDELWLPKLRTLQSLLEGHMTIEEGLVLPAAKDILGAEAMARFEREYPGKEKEVLRSMSSGPSII